MSRTHEPPLTSPKPFSAFTPEEYHTYVRSLYRAPPVPAPLAEFAVRLNAKGNPVITVRRKPKFLLPEEVDSLAEQISWTKQDMWLEVKKRKIEIKLPPRKGKPRAPAKEPAKPKRTRKRKDPAVSIP